MAIHPTAIVDPQAEIGEDVEIGPYCVVGPQVVLDRGVRLDAHAVVWGPTRLGAECRLHAFTAVGGEPQDRKYRGEPTRLEVGRRTVFREYVTAHRGSGAHGVTVIGDDCLFLAHSHVAHDCCVGNGVVFANSAAIAGHVTVGDHANLGGMAGVHQHARVGRYAMVGAGAMVAQDVPPFSIVQGDRARIWGMNLIGLRRHGFTSETVEVLRRTFRYLFQQGLALATAVETLSEQERSVAEVVELLDFVRSSKRGVCRAVVTEDSP